MAAVHRRAARRRAAADDALQAQDRAAQEVAFSALYYLVGLLYLRGCAQMSVLVGRAAILGEYAFTSELGRTFRRVLSTPLLAKPAVAASDSHPSSPSSTLFSSLSSSVRRLINLAYLHTLAPLVGLTLAASHLLAAAPPTFLFWHAVALRLEGSHSSKWELLAYLGATCGVGSICASLSELLSLSCRSPPRPAQQQHRGGGAQQRGTLTALCFDTCGRVQLLLDVVCFHTAWWPYFVQINAVARSIRVSGLAGARGVTKPATAAVLLLLPALLGVHARLSESWRAPAAPVTRLTKRTPLDSDSVDGAAAAAEDGIVAETACGDDASWPIERANPWLRGLLLMVSPKDSGRHRAKAGAQLDRMADAHGEAGRLHLSHAAAAATARRDESSDGTAGRRLIRMLEAAFESPLPWELHSPAGRLIDAALVDVVGHGLLSGLPQLAELLRTVANATLLTGRARSNLASGLRELIAQQEELQAPAELRLSREAVEAFCEILDDGATLGLSGRLRGDIDCEHRVVVQLRVRTSGPKVAVFGKAFKAHVVQALSDAAGVPLVTLVEAPDAAKLLKIRSSEAEAPDSRQETWLDAQLPFEKRADAATAAARLQEAIGSMELAGELLPQQEGVRFDVCSQPQISTKSGRQAQGKVPTPLHMIRETLHEELEEAVKSCYRQDCCEEYYEKSVRVQKPVQKLAVAQRRTAACCPLISCPPPTVPTPPTPPRPPSHPALHFQDVEFKFGAEVEGTGFNVCISPFGRATMVHLGELSLRDVDVLLPPGAIGLRWEEPNEDAPPGRVGSLKLSLEMKPRHVVLKTHLGVLSPQICLPVTPLRLDFKGGRLTIEATLEVEGGTAVAAPGKERLVAAHVQEGGAGVYLTLDRLEFSDDGFELSTQAWAQLDALLNSGTGFLRILHYIPSVLPAVNLVLPAMQSIAQTAADVKRTMASWGLRRRSSMPEPAPHLQAQVQPPKPSSPQPPSQFLSLNRVANLLLEVISSAGPSAVQRMPLTNVATLEAPFRRHIQYLVAARARQHERSKAHIERETQKREVAAKRASDQWLRFMRARRSTSQAVTYSTPSAGAVRAAEPNVSRPANERRQTWWKWAAAPMAPAAETAEATKRKSGADEVRTPPRAAALQPSELSKDASPPSAIKASMAWWQERWQEKWKAAFAEDGSRAPPPAAPAAAASLGDPTQEGASRRRTDEEEEEALAARVTAAMALPIYDMHGTIEDDETGSPPPARVLVAAPSAPPSAPAPAPAVLSF